ncbi:MAG: hypothetical protein K2X27_01630 [Candidatus Obscuribacterales bacterium]|nr:hypothetical protein [Candidatus Obscuribacterales bacterium]
MGVAVIKVLQAILQYMGRRRLMAISISLAILGSPFFDLSMSEFSSRHRIALHTQAAVASNSVSALRMKIPVKGGELDVSLPGKGWTDATLADFQDWLRFSAAAVVSYYGSFPLRNTRIRIFQSNGDTVEYGETNYDDENERGTIDVYVGRRVNRATLLNSWTLTHEMVHLTFPIVDEDDVWLAEGIATYVEPIGRARQGLLSKEKVWLDLVEGLPNGLNPRLRRGLKGSSDWGRIYWGGALFCLLADLKIRSATKNKLGLEDALRAVSSSGGNAASDWTPEQALAVADRRVGQPILLPLYKRFQSQAVWVDLDELWRLLGVHARADDVFLSDSAPLSSTRDLITGVRQ